MTSKRRKPASGIATDSSGGPIVDPSKNVLDLVDAANIRQDDLRRADQQRYEAELRHVQEMAELRATHAREMRQAETDRIDAIRAVDVGAVQRAAEVALTQASTLAAQVATSAETLRGQVAAAATVQANALAASDNKQAAALANGLAPLQKAVEELRQAQFLTAGSKAQVGESRLNVGAILGGMSLLVAVIVAIILVINSTRG
jgi:hypothetical protein